MKDEYIIINKTAIQKRIEELENKKLMSTEVKELKKVLLQSTPLIPEIERAYTKAFSEGIVFGVNTEYRYETSQNYISDLKLDI